MNAEQLRCGFCYDRQQGKRGEIKREWSEEWGMFIPLCRVHSKEMQQYNDRELSRRAGTLEAEPEPEDGL